MSEIWEPCDKNLQKQNKLVRWDKKMKNSYKIWCFQVQTDEREVGEFSENH